MIILYSTNCPRCKVIEKKLQLKNIDFIVDTDVSKMMAKGFRQAPILEIDENFLDFAEANQWINKQEKVV